MYFVVLLLSLFALGGLLAYASSLADPQSGHARSDLRTKGLALIALAVIATVLAAALRKRFSLDE